MTRYYEAALVDSTDDIQFKVYSSTHPKGFIIAKPGKPIKYLALKPEEVIERVKRNLHVEAKEKSERLERLKSEDVLKELNLLHTQGVKFVEPSDLSGALKGRHNLYNHLDMMIRGAEKNVTLVTTADGLNRKIETLLPTLERAKKRGVKIRIAVPITKSNIRVAKDLSKLAEIKAMDKGKARFCVVDGKELFFMILDDEKVHPSYDVGVWVNTEFFAGALEQLFNSAWDEMKPISKIPAY